MRATSHLCANVEDVPHQTVGFDPWKEAQTTEGRLRKDNSFLRVLNPLQIIQQPVLQSNWSFESEGLSDACTTLTKISDSRTLVSLWIRCKHCPQGAKSLGSCLVNTRYIFNINIPSPPAAEFCVCLISLQWHFNSDSEALREAGGLWKAKSFLCCHLAFFGFLGCAHRSCAMLCCAVKSASDS